MSYQKFLYLYYKARLGGVEYGKKGPGRIDAGRVAKGKPYWRKPHPPVVLKQKSLILADWTASTWDDIKKDKVIHTLIDLMNEGFAVYVWKEGNIVKLNKESIH